MSSESGKSLKSLSRLEIANLIRLFETIDPSLHPIEPTNFDRIREARESLIEGGKLPRKSWKFLSAIDVRNYTDFQLRSHFSITVERPSGFNELAEQIQSHTKTLENAARARVQLEATYDSHLRDLFETVEERVAAVAAGD